MDFSAIERIISLLQDEKIPPEARFWDLSAKKYLIRQRYQDYSVHFDRIFKNVQTSFRSSTLENNKNKDFLFLNLASGKIIGKGKIIDYLLNHTDHQNSHFLVNIDISRKMIEFNDEKLLEMGFTEVKIDDFSGDSEKWLKKNNIFVKNIYGDIEKLFLSNEIIQELIIPDNYKLLCFDGLSNLNLSTESKLENIFKFLTLFSYSYITWLYPGNEFTFFKEKLDFYLKIIRNKQNLPLNYLKINYYTAKYILEDRNSTEHWQEFSNETIGAIHRDIEKFVSKKELKAAQVTFTDKIIDPSIKFHTFYGQFNFLSNLAEKNELKVIYEPKYVIRNKEKSFIKTYPLILIKREH